MKRHLITTLAAILLLSFFTAGNATAQKQDGWKLFEKVSFEKKFFKDLGMFITWPVFDDGIRAWEGKEVMLSGYIIPTAEAPGYTGLILSKYTYSQCFFCGKAGLGTVAEVRMKKKLPDFKIDKPYVFKGKLLLNDSDPDHLCFILTDAELMDL